MFCPAHKDISPQGEDTEYLSSYQVTRSTVADGLAWEWTTDGNIWHGGRLRNLPPGVALMTSRQPDYVNWSRKIYAKDPITAGYLNNVDLFKDIFVHNGRTPFLFVSGAVSSRRGPIKLKYLTIDGTGTYTFDFNRL